MKRALEVGGVVAAVVLIAFGVAAIAMGIDGTDTVGENLSQEQIVGTPDMTPEGSRRKSKMPASRRKRFRCLTAMSLTS